MTHERNSTELESADNFYYSSKAYKGVHCRLEDLPIKKPQQFKKRQPIQLSTHIDGDDYIAGSLGFYVNSTEKEGDRKKKWWEMFKTSKNLIARENHSHEFEYIAPSPFNMATKFYFFSAAGYTIFFLGLFVIPLVSILTFWWGDTHTLQDAISGVEFTIITLLACFLAWKVFTWLGDKCPDNKWEYFNRRTGMLVIPHFGKKAPLEIPFAELIPCMQWLSTSSGTSRHVLAYVHPPTGKGIYAGASTVADVYLRAAYLEQFMDVTKPLPDVPKLEPFRLSDPTTAAHDKSTNRAPHYWRDKTPDEIKAIVKNRQVEVEQIIGDGTFTL